MGHSTPAELRYQGFLYRRIRRIQLPKLRISRGCSCVTRPMRASGYQVPWKESQCYQVPYRERSSCFRLLYVQHGIYTGCAFPYSFVRSMKTDIPLGEHWRVLEALTIGPVSFPIQYASSLNDHKINLHCPLFPAGVQVHIAYLASVIIAWLSFSPLLWINRRLCPS
jgi:hypothetical protein